MGEEVCDASELSASLAPLREIEWSAWSCAPTGLLADRPSLNRRYATIPPEAIPILDLGVGCHYAIWVDDPGAPDPEPGVVIVSPADSFPNAIRARSPAAFRALLRQDDDFLRRGAPEISRERERAEQGRARAITAMTVDGMGVVDPVTSAAKRPVADVGMALRTMQQLLDEARGFDTLFVARNAIARFGACIGMCEVVATVYEAIERSDYAEVALRSYEPSAVDLERERRLEAMRARHERLGGT